MSLHASFSSALSSPLAATNQCLDENAALELLDARIASAARTRIERHLEGCDACRELVAELTKVDGVGDQSAEIKAPATAAAGSSFAQSQNADTQEQAFHLARELAAGARVGPYRIEQAIGSGSFGTVYRAIDESRTGQVVALKMVVDPALRARFSREAATLSRLDHPAIVRYVGHGVSNEGMYLAMEWLEGEDLEQRLRRGGALGWQQARLLGLRLAAALAHAHRLGCVHRDLSPRNVYLPHARVEDAKLLDFGLVRIDTASFQTSMALERTATQAMLGTPYYMSPEQIRDPKSVDGRADLFGLGILLFESICGKRPFDGDDLFTVWIKIVDQPAPDLRKLAREPVPDALVQLVESLLAKEPAARPQSASDVERVLMNLNPAVSSSSIAMTSAPSAPPTSIPSAPPAIAYSAPPAAMSGIHYSAPPPPVSSAPLMAPFVTGPPPPIHPSFLPPSYAQQQPASQPKSRTGLYIAVGAVSATVVIVGAGAVGVAAALHGGAIVAPPSATPAPNGGAAPNSNPTSASPTSATAAKKAGGANTPATSTAVTATPTPSATPTNKAAKGGAQPPERFFCGGDQVTTRSGGNYVAENEAGDSVVVGGDCKATLEDCTIAGPHSVNVLGTSSLTLRRCRIAGDVKLVGPSPTLILEGTSTPRAPQIVGGGKVIRR